MKKKNISLVAALGLAMIFASCSSELTECLTSESVASASGKQQMTFTATQEESDAQTRTTIDGANINWQSDDAVAIWDGTEINPFKVTSGAGTTSAVLSGEVTSGSESFIAVYPYSLGKDCICSIDDRSISGIDIPDIQTATEGTYDPKAAIMTASATSTNTNFSFRNVCSFLKITPSVAYQKIVISVNSGVLSGNFECKSYNDDPTLTAVYLKNKVTLVPASGLTTITPNKTYYVALAPGTISGITIDCFTDATNYYEKTITGKSYTLARSTCYDLGTVGGEATKKVPTGGYSVSDTKKVMFTTGNLYWNGSEYCLENRQTDYTASRSDESHIGYFFWANYSDYTKDGMQPYASTYKYESQTLQDEFWCGENHPLSIGSLSNLYTLTSNEWVYLFKTRANASNLYKILVTVNDGTTDHEDCVLIAPDDFDVSKWHTGDREKKYTLAEIKDLGITCLPASGGYYQISQTKYDVIETNVYATYWSATPGANYVNAEDQAYVIVCPAYDDEMNLTVNPANYEYRKYGLAIRLVYTYTGE